jgi:hypothetical protein
MVLAIIDSPQTEFEVELPATHLRHVALFVRERQSELNNLEEVDVTPHGLKVIIRARTECSYRTSDDTRELGILP